MNNEISNFMKTRQAEAELFHADGQTGRRQTSRQKQKIITKLIVAFFNFAKAPKSGHTKKYSHAV